MPANCILAITTNYTWAGILEDVAAAMKAEKPKSCARIKLEMTAERAQKIKFRSTIETAKNKRLRINSKVTFLQKSHLNKAFTVAIQQSKWQQQAKVYKDTLETMLASGFDDERVEELREKY